MNENNDEKNKIQNTSKSFYRVFLDGVLLGGFFRFGLWGFEYTTYLASQKENTKSMYKLYVGLLNWKSFCFLNKTFFETGFVQIWGRAANLGILHLVNIKYPELSTWQKTAITATFGSFLDTATTSHGEFWKVKKFFSNQEKVSENKQTFFRKIKIARNHPQQFFKATIDFLFPPGFSYVVKANFIRNFGTSVITFGGIYKGEELLKPFFPEAMSDTLTAKFVSILILNVPIQFANMPFINFQTYVLRNPTKAIPQAFLAFYHEHTVCEIFKATHFRIVHRGLFYACSLVTSEYLSRREKIKKLRIEQGESEEMRVTKRRP